MTPRELLYYNNWLDMKHDMNVEMAQRMLAEHIDQAIIARVTQLPPEEIQHLVAEPLPL